MEMLAPDPRFERIDAMEGREFEDAVAELFELLGYDVEQTPFYDKGADIIAVRDGVRTAVQVKRWRNAVSVDGVRQLIDGMKQYGCTRGLLVTNSFLSDPALRSAKAWEIEVWDRAKLADFIDGEAPKVDTSVCAECQHRVTPGVTAFCLAHPGRFGGLVYCFAHQPRRARRSRPSS